MTGLVTQTGLPNGAPSNLCKRRTLMNKKTSRLFNYLVLILSVPHIDRVDFIGRLEEHEKKKLTTGIHTEDVRDALSDLHDNVSEIDIDYNEESKTYSNAVLENGDSPTYSGAIFEVKNSADGTVLNMSTTDLFGDDGKIDEYILGGEGKKEYYIKLTQPHGFAALRKVEKQCMDSLVQDGFAERCKMRCQDNPTQYTEDMYFISKDATSNRAMKYRTIIYNSESKEVMKVIEYLYDNPGFWTCGSIKDAFMAGYKPKGKSQNITSMKHLLCDVTRDPTKGGGRKNLRLTNALYPEGEPAEYNTYHGEYVDP